MTSRNGPPKSKRQAFKRYFSSLVRSSSRSTSSSTPAPTPPSAPSPEPPQTQYNTPPPDIPTTTTTSEHVDEQATPAKVNSSWDDLKASLQVIQAYPELVPSFIEGVGILLECFDRIEVAARNQPDYEDLGAQLATLSRSIIEYIKTSPVTMSGGYALHIMVDIGRQAEEMRKNVESQAAGRQSGADEDVIRYYRQIQSLFQKLEANVSMSAWSTANARSVEASLKGLSPVKLAPYDSLLSAETARRGCTKGTRTYVLSKLDDWQDSLDAPSVYWMNGMAGTGKTTIAFTFSERLERRGQLAASFFCTRVSPDCRHVAQIIPTIASQLARRSPPFQSALCEILARDPDVASKHIQKQFERLLLDPLMKIKNIIPENLVVVIDALEECEDRVGLEVFLGLLSRHAEGMPLKFFITSRPEPEIYQHMMLEVKDRQVMHLHDVETSLVQADIELYLKEELSSMSLTDSQIKQLAKRSGSLFIYAATLVQYILPGKLSVDPQHRLQTVLGQTSKATKMYGGIDALYTSILQSALDESQIEEDEADDVKLVLRTVVFAQEPIGLETIAKLAGLEERERAADGLLPLRSVVRQSEDTGLVSTFERSFPDFLVSQERSGPYFCDIAEHSPLLARQCFQIMQDALRFNICDLDSPFVTDDEVDNLQARVADKISPTLSYACRHWATHLLSAPKEDHLLESLGEFLRHRLLFWIEAMCLRRELETGSEMLLRIKKWLMETPELSGSGLISMLDDAHCFMRDFAASPASRSTPHLYVSSLQLCSRSSMVHRFYSKYFKDWLKPLELFGSLAECKRMSGIEKLNHNVGSGVLSIAFSPDGHRVLMGCEDGTIRIHDMASNSLPLISRIDGHTDWVRCVVFSPDGSRILSSSSDCTIRMWDATTGAPVGTPEWFKGHSYPVKSVAFSPDGRRIVSGSWDNTVRIWDAENGGLIDVLEGHKWGVNCVAFSPDNMTIVSGANDHTIRAWDISNGSLGPATPSKTLTGHTNSVMSITFTPDGRLVSGSVDCTICVWRVSDGAILTRIFQGRNHPVYSVSVSPDGTHVASGSADPTIRRWNIVDGSFVSPTLIGHSSGVRSVAFSPNETSIISGSHDQTVRIWGIGNELEASVSGDSLPDHAGRGAVKEGGAENTYDTITTTPAHYQEYATRVDAFQKDFTEGLLRGQTRSPVVTFAWLLGHSHFVCSSQLDEYDATNSGLAISSDREITLPESHVLRPDGWVLNSGSELLFCVPHSVIFHRWCSHKS
ncbi:unnamed protein product [Rhizoctonia solani]|uniref:NACHT domain-containing protein n=1 Tax=Rhizoctonia solani TaxID=456999 RepID=A0A8H3AIV1_9AGAM|nr:unnamed protein product [Rhizoctonia solani]